MLMGVDLMGKAALAGIESGRANADERAVSAEAWKAWVADSFEQGAGAVHKWSKRPEVQIQKIVALQDGTLTAEPLKVLGKERVAYKSLWAASDSPDGTREPACDPLPDPVVEEVRASAKGFKRRTATSLDGFHVRHYGILEDAGLVELILIFRLLELVGNLPPQLRFTRIALIPKPAGGLRPIGLFASLYRIWGRVRRWHCEAWEAANRRRFFAAAKGNAAVSTVWRQGVANEAAAGTDGMEALSVLWDGVKFYETFCHQKLRARALASGFPIAILNLCLAAYKAARYITCGIWASKALYPSKGIIAGCFAATTLVKVYVLEPFDRLQRAMPQVESDYFIDDFTFSMRGPPRVIGGQILRFAAKLKAVMEDDLQVGIALGEVAVVSSKPGLARVVREGLGRVGGRAVADAKNLGVDYSAGKARGAKGCGATRKKRMWVAQLKRPRLRRIANMAGWRTKRLFTAGVQPAAVYGAHVNGISDAELEALRRTMGACVSPKAQGRSLALTLLLAGDETWRATAAPIQEYSKAVWEATIDMEPRGFTMAQLRKFWEEVRPEEVRRWMDVKGPLGAYALLLRRLR